MNDLSIGIGVARCSVQSIVGALGGAVVIGYRQHIDVCVIGVALCVVTENSAPIFKGGEKTFFARNIFL